jgi:fibro-slime domain-containing protein
MRFNHHSLYLLPLFLFACGTAGEQVSRDKPGSSGNPTGGSNSSVTPNGGSSPNGNNGGSTPNGGGPSVTQPVDSSGIIVDDPGTILGGGGGTPAPGCGNGELTDDEACDDGNVEGGDGCAATCLSVDPGFSCVVPGEPCRAIAVCGDGVVADSEQCDDKNVADGDGCSNRCRVEFGKKCEGAPSVCSDTTCGDGNKEGAESCDDGNTNPFDGCSSICLREPDCSGGTCVSECGDGLLLGDNEGCDDGNTTDGDGCSHDCQPEQGFTCSQEATCEKIDGECVLRVPAIFRDFSSDHPDFEISCDGLTTGITETDLDDEGRPVLKDGSDACIKDANSFSQWFRDGDYNVRVNGNLVLFDNGDGGYVNRYGADGEKFVATVRSEDEMQVNGTCEAGCTERTRNGLQCDNVCRPENDAVRQRTQQLTQAEDELARAETELATAQAELDAALEEVEPNEATVTALEATLATREAAVETRQTAVDTITADIADLEVEADACNGDCQAEFDAETATCVDDCGPCAFPNEDKNCTGSTTVEFDGNPLFFPVDSVMGETRDEGAAKVPEEYGYNGWPNESEVFGGNPMHNFYFTSEVQYWFRYDADTDAKLDFTGDDDVWVFINGKLAVDLGGAHVPENGTVTINAMSAARFGLTAGNVYKITVFQVERKKYGSSFKLTLSGFEATPSDCSAICGDGVLSFGEECDDGVNDGGYGECASNCRLAEYCGNGIVEADEDCDNGPGGGPGCPSCRILRVL